MQKEMVEKKEYEGSVSKLKELHHDISQLRCDISLYKSSGKSRQEGNVEEKDCVLKYP